MRNSRAERRGGSFNVLEFNDLAMREVVLDTETTGLDPKSGHRMVEIGCVELLNHLPTGRTFHRYLNLERTMPAEAQAVHGLSDEFLRDQPVFAAVVDEFLAFLADSRLVIHNADFDLGFINAELAILGRPGIARDRAVDTVKMARNRFPGAPASLDALCRRFQIDISDRKEHGGLKDARLLAAVYLELQGGSQPGLTLTAARKPETEVVRTFAHRKARPHAPSADEEAAHTRFVARLKQPLWNA